MINLLPRDHKQMLIREYRWRIAIITSILVGICTAIAGLFLVPSYLLVLTRERAAAEDLAIAARASSASESANIEARTASLGTKITLLKTEEEHSEISALMRELTATRISGVTIANIRITAATKNAYSVVILGHADDRRQLLLFTESLKQNLHFKNINLPIDELVKNADISYQITLDYHH